jgi:hypothetical protein
VPANQQPMKKVCHTTSDSKDPEEHAPQSGTDLEKESRLMSRGRYFEACNWLSGTSPSGKSHDEGDSIG